MQEVEAGDAVQMEGEEQLDVVERERAARRAFLEARQAGVGSSELVGTPDREGNIERPGLFDGGALDVYHRITRPVTDEDVDEGRDKIDLMRGILQEPIAVSLYFRLTGRSGRRVKGQQFHPDYPGAMASRDALIFRDGDREVWQRGTAPLEIKNPRSGGFHRLFEHGTSQQIILQLQYQIAVARAEWGSFGFCNFEHSRGPIIPVDVAADTVVGEWLLEQVARFWTEHVVPRVPPDPVAWAQLLDKAPEVKPTRGALVTLDPEQHAEPIEITRRLIELGALLKDGEEAKRELQAKLDGWLLLHFAEHAKFEAAGLGKVTRVTQAGRTTFDAAALREHRPIDRDAFVRWYRAGADDPDDADRAADELALDVSRFDRQGQPFSFLRLYPAKP